MNGIVQASESSWNGLRGRCLPAHFTRRSLIPLEAAGLADSINRNAPSPASISPVSEPSRRARSGHSNSWTNGLLPRYPASPQTRIARPAGGAESWPTPDRFRSSATGMPHGAKAPWILSCSPVMLEGVNRFMLPSNLVTAADWIRATTLNGRRCPPLERRPTRQPTQGRNGYSIHQGSEYPRLHQFDLEARPKCLGRIEGGINRTIAPTPPGVSGFIPQILPSHRRH